MLSSGSSPYLDVVESSYILKDFEKAHHNGAKSPSNPISLCICNVMSH